MATGEADISNEREEPPYCEVCYESDPSQLTVRQLRGTEWRGCYCHEHDPLTDPEVSDMWEPQ